MTTTLERAARAAHAANTWDGSTWSDGEGGFMNVYSDIVRAVLMAVREPDGIMLGAGDKVFNHGCHGSTWPAMIDAILSEKEHIND